MPQHFFLNKDRQNLSVIELRLVLGDADFRFGHFFGIFGKIEKSKISEGNVEEIFGLLNRKQMFGLRIRLNALSYILIVQYNI